VKHETLGGCEMREVIRVHTQQRLYGGRFGTIPSSEGLVSDMDDVPLSVGGMAGGGPRPSPLR